MRPATASERLVISAMAGLRLARAGALGNGRFAGIGSRPYNPVGVQTGNMRGLGSVLPIAEAGGDDNRPLDSARGAAGAPACPLAQPSQECARSVTGAALGGAANGPWLLPPRRVRARFAAGPRVRGRLRHATGLQLHGTGCSFADRQHPLRRAADPARLRGTAARHHRRRLGEWPNTPGSVLAHRAAADLIGRALSGSSDLRSYDGRVRGGADGGRQHPWRHSYRGDCTLRRNAGSRWRGRGFGGSAAGRFLPFDRRGAIAVAASGAVMAPTASAGLSVRLEQAEPIPLAAEFAVAAGELLALVGPSGSGKTTVLRCIAGLHRARNGHMRCGDTTWFDSENGADLAPQERSVGFVFQNYALFPHLTAI